MDESPDVSACTRCPALVESRSRIVNGTGNPTAELVLVGEAPGQYEDEEGEPFVGRSGDVLESVLADLGVDREQLRITNCVRCRPPENRDPTVTELENCRNHLDRELATIDPTVVCALGKVPAEQLLDRSVRVTSEAGAVESVTFGGRSRDLVICPHPAATLYDPSQRESFAKALGTAVDRANLHHRD